MNHLFNFDNPVIHFLSKAFDVMLLSVIWILFSIPIITLGASTSAMYYTTVKVIRRERGYVFGEFYKSFKQNLIQGMIAFIISVAVVGLFIINIMFARNMKGQYASMLEALYIAMCAIAVGTTVYIFPVLSRFSMKVITLLKTCFFLFFKHFPQSIILILIVAGSAILLYILPVLFLFLPVCSTLLFSLVMETVLKKYTPHSENGDKDEWYLE